jgi:hypothetical protein
MGSGIEKMPFPSFTSDFGIVCSKLAADTEISFSVRKPDKMRAFRNKQMEP